MPSTATDPYGVAGGAALSGSLTAGGAMPGTGGGGGGIIP